MEAKLNEWEKESISSSGSVAQNLKSKLSETQEKLDKLMSVYLDNDIERSQYLERKDILLRQKASIEESLRNFGQQRKNWLQPLRSFVLSLREAADLAETDNYIAWRDFFRKIGSNPSLKDKTMHFHTGELWEFTAFALGESRKDGAILALAKSLKIPNPKFVSLGDVIIHFARTFFEGRSP